jgi:S1-C subfamily serine protease
MTTGFRNCLVAGVLALKMASAYALSVQSPIYLEAHTRIMLGQLEQAVELAKSNDADLSPEQSALLIAEVYAEIGQGEKAIQILSSIEPADMNMEFREKILEIYAQTGNSFELNKRLTSSTHTEVPGLKYLALASMKKSGNGKYLKSLKTKAANRSDMDAVRDLAWVYFQIGAYAEAIKTLKGEAPSERAFNAKDRVLLALSYERIHQRTKACQALELKKSPEFVSDEGQLTANLIGELLSCVEKSATKIDKHVSQSKPESVERPKSSQSHASEALTMKPHGAFKSDESRVSYVDRFSGKATRNLPIPDGVGITGASGILLGNGSYVLTNRHVVEEGRYFAVKNALGSVSKAKVIKVSEQDDLALLELEQPFPSNQAIAADEISAAKPGGQIYSMGYPLWYLLGSETPSITNGLVSKNSGMNDDPKMFQITAKINKGNSGGPVFDRFGNLIGLTTAKLDTVALRQSEGVDPEGVNFIYQAREILDFAGRYFERENHAASQRQSLSAEEVYAKRLGSTVMVAVGR